VKNKYLFNLLKILAFVIPYYFVFYGPLHEKPENPKMMILWKYVLLGFSSYIIFLFIAIYVI